MSYLVPFSAQQLSFELTKQQVDEIVVDELKFLYAQQVIDSDWKMVEAIDALLQYYLPPNEYELWQMSIRE